MNVLLMLAIGQVGFATPCDTAVVCAPALVEAVQPWVDYRESQGRRVVVIPGDGSARDVRQRIRRLADLGGLKFLVIVGDAAPQAFGNAAIRHQSVETHLARAKVNVRYGSPPLLATDNWFADLDDDRAPDLAVGRLAADSPAELSSIIEKIKRYERDDSPADWRRRIHLVAGLSGLGFVTDAAIEGVTANLIARGVPAEFDTVVTQGRWGSPYCPHPAAFHRTAVDTLNAGCLFWVYMGHGSCRALARLPMPDGAHHVFDHDDVARLHCAHGPPIALLLCCLSGAFDAAEDCLAEDLLRSPGGPVAVLAGSRVTMPYGMGVLGRELIVEHFSNRSETLGEMILAAKRRTLDGQSADEQRKLLDQVASVLSSRDRLAEERAEHALLFNLLGDPLLQIAHPGTITLDAPDSATAGGELSINGLCSHVQEVEVELMAPRDRLTFQPPPRGAYSSDVMARDECAETYSRANRRGWSRQRVVVVDGRFEVRLPVPLAAIGPCHVRAFAADGQVFAVGSRDIVVVAPGDAP